MTAARWRVKVPGQTIRRLSTYVGLLAKTAGSGVQFLSSADIGRELGLPGHIIRRDLNYFGEFGTPGLGYEVTSLSRNIKKILGMDRAWNLVVVGAGKLGSALCNYRGLVERGFQIVAAVDVDPGKIGQEINGIPVIAPDMLPDLVHREGVALGILSCPGHVAQEMAEHLAAVGIMGLINLTPWPVKFLPEAEVYVEQVDITFYLESLAFGLTWRDSAGEDESEVVRGGRIAAGGF